MPPPLVVLMVVLVVVAVLEVVFRVVVGGRGEYVVLPVEGVAVSPSRARGACWVEQGQLHGALTCPRWANLSPGIK